jgi:hypothetical protein
MASNPYNPALVILIQAAENRYSRMRPTERRGQAYFNALYDLRPIIADAIRGTDDDPFQVDEKLPQFLMRVAELLEEA